jgi:hypothetical protein
MKELEVKCVDLSRFEWNPNRQLAYRAAVKAQDKVVEATYLEERKTTKVPVLLYYALLHFHSSLGKLRAGNPVLAFLARCKVSNSIHAKIAENSGEAAFTLVCFTPSCIWNALA